MKRIFFLAALALPLLVSSCKTKEPQTAEAENTDEYKEIINLKEDTENPDSLTEINQQYIAQPIDSIFFESCKLNPFENRDKEMAYIDSAGMGLINYYPDFYPLGWSKDGKLAYCIKQYFDGRGETLIRFIIQDTITDKIIYQLDDWNCGSISLFVANYGSDINSMIFDNKIILNRSAFNSPRDSAEFSFKIKATNFKEDEYGLKTLDYFVQAWKGNKSKILMTKKEVPANSVFVCGSLKSPYEDRLAIIIAEVKYGFEGHDITYLISGCHTKVGF